MSLTTSATSLESLKSAIDAGIESWKAAGIAIVDLIDNHGMTLGQISESINSPVVNPNVLAQFERIGRNQVLPRLLVASFPAAKAMQKLPLSEQRRLLDQGTDVMVMRTGGADTIIIRPEDMTKDQAQQVFSKDGVRSLSAQRAFIEGKASETAAMSKVKQSPWIIKSGRVIFREACEMSRQELTILLSQMQ